MKPDEYVAEASRLGHIYSEKLTDLRDIVDGHSSLMSYSSFEACISAELEMIRAGKEWKDFCIHNGLNLSEV